VGRVSGQHIYVSTLDSILSQQSGRKLGNSKPQKRTFPLGELQHRFVWWFAIGKGQTWPTSFGSTRVRSGRDEMKTPGPRISNWVTRIPDPWPYHDHRRYTRQMQVKTLVLLISTISVSTLYQIVEFSSTCAASFVTKPSGSTTERVIR